MIYLLLAINCILVILCNYDLYIEVCKIKEILKEMRGE